MANSKRVLIIGLDGATFDLIRPWVRENKLPALTGLLAAGASGDLTSTFPPMSAQAWTSFMTGCNIGKHGLTDFVMREPDSYGYRIVNGAVRDGDTLWGLLSDRGYRVGVINVPMTYPPEEVNGFLVSGMDAPSLGSEFTFPRSLRKHLLQSVPGYVLESGGHNHLQGRSRRFGYYLQTVLDSARARLDATRLLMRENEWDVLVTVFRLTDTTAHWFWKHMDPHHPFHRPEDEAWSHAIETSYRYADECVAALLRECDEDTTVVVVSDHGFGPCGDRVLYLNTWLQQQGFLVFKDSAGSGASHVVVSKVIWPLWRAMKRHLPTRFKRWLKKSFPRLERRVPSLLALSSIDWERTRAYALDVRPAIYINLKGREPKGIVEPGAEYESLREEITRCLHTWRDPIDDQAVVEQVIKREDLYHGPHLDRIADLLLKLRSPDGYMYQLHHENLTKVKHTVEVISEHDFELTLWPNASHTLNGICLFKGPTIRSGAQLSGASIVDVAPTVLHLLGESIPDEMDGRVLTEAIDPDWLAAHPATYSSDPARPRETSAAAYDEGEIEQVEARLRGLGYLD